MKADSCVKDQESVKKRPCIRCIAAFFQIIEKEDKS